MNLPTEYLFFLTAHVFCFFLTDQHADWACYEYTEEEITRIDGGEAASDVCNSEPLRTYTGGVNGNYPGCGLCRCCIGYIN